MDFYSYEVPGLWRPLEGKNTKTLAEVTGLFYKHIPLSVRASEHKTFRYTIASLHHPPAVNRINNRV